MKERPILFSGPMVRAILSGVKTQTRRVIKPQPVQYNRPDWPCTHGWREVPQMGGWEISWNNDSMTATEAIGEYCPYGKTGDQLWVRETWRVNGNAHDYARAGKESVFYRADEDWNVDAGWRPSIFMPRWASRITLEVVSVRVQRLQGITSEDAQAEGIEVDICDNAIVTRDYSRKEKWFQMWSDDLPNYVDIEQIAQASYRSLWDHINGKREGCAWQDNPWVWAVEFRAVTA